MTAISTGTGGTDRSDFDQFRRLQQELMELADDLTGVVSALGQNHLAKSAREVSAKVANDRFTVLVVGEFNAGKSTVVNAMLGRKVLPASIKPTTAVLTVVRWGEQPTATLYAADRASLDGLDRTPVPVPVDSLEKHLVIGDRNDAEPGWGLAELLWPLPVCRNGVDVVDSPGLNDHPDREVITMDFLGRADAVVFVLSALQALKNSERSFADEYLRLFRHDNFFFLVNRMNQVDEDEAGPLLRDIRDQVRGNWDIRPERVLPVNALAALKSRQNGDPPLAASGLPEFERDLERFLTTERGRLKVVPPALEIQRLTAEARGGIEDTAALLDVDVEKLSTEYERQRGPLESLGRDHQIIVRTIDNHLAETRVLVEESARACLNRAAAQCATWAAEVERQNKVGFNVFKARQNLTAVVEEIGTGLGERVQRHVADWEKEELTALLTARTTDLAETVGDDLTSFVQDLRGIRLSFRGKTDVPLEKLPSPGERSAALAAGLLLDPGSALVGAQFGFKEMLKGVLPQLALAIGVAFVGFGPGALLLTLFGSGVIRTVIKKGKFDAQLVTTVADTTAERLRADAPAAARRIAGKVFQHLSTIREKTDERLAAELAKVAESVQFALRQRDENRRDAETAKRELGERRDDLNSIDQRAAAVLQRWVSGD
ncbi:dynamin family protein [Streptomyces sp. NPDC003688]